MGTKRTLCYVIFGGGNIELKTIPVVCRHVGAWGEPICLPIKAKGFDCIGKVRQEVETAHCLCVAVRSDHTKSHAPVNLGSCVRAD